MSKYPTKLFDIRTQEVNDKQKGKIKKAKVQFAKGIEIFFEGKKVDLGEYNSVFLKKYDEVVEGLEYAVNNFGLSEERAEEQVRFMDEKNVTSICEVMPPKK